LQWSGVNRQTKTIFLGRSKNGEPRILPLVRELDRIIERRWQARSIKNQNGSTTLATYVFHCGDGQPIGDTRKGWRAACSKAGIPSLLFHDLRRSAVRNFDKNGVSQIVGMMILGHKAASVYKRYRIVPENHIREALQKVEQAIEQQKKNRPVRTMTGKADSAPQLPVRHATADTGFRLVGAVGIEPTTFGLKGRCSTTELRPYGANQRLYR
jgi:integrase-like protein